MNTTIKCRSWRALGLLLLAVSFPAAANHFYLSVYCIEPTPPPKCCELVSDSAGAGAEYQWQVDGTGWVDEAFTDVNYNTYHCGGTTGDADIFVFSPPHAGHGYVNCQSIGM